MTNRIPEAAVYLARWLGGGEQDGDAGHGEFGVHIEYSDLYHAVLFLVCVYMGGQLASYITMPSLVGEIVVGILLGPSLAGFVPNAPAWVMLGEIGLILLVLEAGIDIDVATLKLIGTRGLLIAIVGSFLPISLGIAIALAINGTDDITAAIAAGATFGPTSLGIALNVLRGGGILNTPIGQMIISAAVIDDMIALIVLSQLRSLTGTITVSTLLIPILSAGCFLVIGGSIALFIMPALMERYLLIHIKPENQGKAAMAVMFALLVVLMPATYYAKASYLMGAFIAGLSFCTNHDVHVQFVRQFKRILQWLMRIFFAASIGFQVPIKEFAQGHVIWQGLAFTVALLGKLCVGFMVPNFSSSKKFTGIHLRDCLITGFSMAAEGEFAFIIAVYCVDQGLIDKDLYASVVLAVLLSTIFPPFLLRTTIAYYNRKAQETLQGLAKDEMERNYDLEHEASKSQGNPEGSDTASDTSSSVQMEKSKSRHEKLMEELHAKTAVFLCIQTQSEGRWGLMHQIMATLAELGLEIIDHRSWHPRGIHATLFNEIYAKDSIEIPKKGEANAILQERMQLIKDALSNAIHQPETSKVKVQRWFPGVVEEIIESGRDTGYGNDTKKTATNVNLEQRLLSEANAAMDKRQSLHLSATKQKTVEEILAEMKSHIIPASVEETSDVNSNVDALIVSSGAADDVHTDKQKRAKRRTHKMRSTPVVGGGFFDEDIDEDKSGVEKMMEGVAGGGGIGGTGNGQSEKWSLGAMGDLGSHGHRAEIIVEGQSYSIRIDNWTLKSLQTGLNEELLDSHGVSVMEGGGSTGIQPDNANVTNMLQGYVRHAQQMSKIVEDANDLESETSSLNDGAQPQAGPEKAEKDSEDELHDLPLV